MEHQNIHASNVAYEAYNPLSRNDESLLYSTPTISNVFTFSSHPPPPKKVFLLVNIVQRMRMMMMII